MEPFPSELGVSQLLASAHSEQGCHAPAPGLCELLTGKDPDIPDG